MRSFILAVLLLPLLAAAQQEPRYSQFLYGKLALNPAYAGSRDATSLGSLYRHQWTNIEQAPRTATLSVHSPLANRRLALGAQIVHDRLGLIQTTSLQGHYAYRLPLGEGRLAMGLQLGITHQQIDLAGSNPLDAADPLLAVSPQRWLPSAGAGVYYQTRNAYAGLSAPQFLRQDLPGVNGSGASQARHWAAMGGYAWQISPEFTLHPQALLLWAEGAPAQAEANLSAMLAGAFWMGLGYRSSSTLVANMAYELPNGLRIGYAYDLMLGPLSSQTGGSHEILLGFDLGRNSVRLYNPRQSISPVF
jgi:type IX secretion system PorP/SprF family membrane protein